MRMTLLTSRREAVVASMVVGGHQPPGGSSEWLRLITYNNQILEGAAGGGERLGVCRAARGRVDDASRLTNVPTDGLTTKAPPSIAASLPSIYRR